MTRCKRWGTSRSRAYRQSTAAGRLAFWVAYLGLLSCATPELPWRLSRARRAMITQADSFELFALDSNGHQSAPTAFLGYSVLATTPGDATRVRAALIGAFDTATGSLVCFSPHHAVRVRRGRETLDIVLCTHCGNASFGQGPFLPFAPGSIAPLFEATFARIGWRLVEPIGHDERPHWQHGRPTGPT